MELILSNKTLTTNDKFIAVEKENKSAILIVKITDDSLLNKWPFIEFETDDGNKYSTSKLEIVDNEIIYELPNGLLTSGYLKIQVVFRNNDDWVWKSHIKEVKVANAINASDDLPVEYPDFIAEAQEILNETVEALAEIKDIEEDLTERVELVEATVASYEEAESERVAAENTRQSNENIRKQNESTRQANETLRNNAETTRSENETARINAESLRASNETTRQGNESTRISNENARTEAESLRVSSETTRENNESTRISNENARIQAEILRVNAEQSRVSAENTRSSNETSRVNAESQRVSQESTRQSNETTRGENETTRQSNEATRQENEQTRQSNETARETWFEGAQAQLNAKADKTYVDEQDDAIEYSLNKLKAMFYETTVEEEQFTKDYLSFDSLPSVVNSKNVIFAGGMDLKNIKGRSYAYNQLAYQGANSDYWTWNSGLTYFAFSSSRFTIKSQSASTYWSVVLKNKTINNHKYYVKLNVTTFSSTFYLQLGGSDYSREISSSGVKNYIITGNGSEPIGIKTGATNISDTVIEFYVIDLTQWFGSNDEIPSDLLSNPSLFTTKYWLGDLPYNVGAIKDSKPLKLIGRGFNLFDEVMELGDLNSSNGQNYPDSTRLRSKNYVDVHSITTIYFRTNSSYTGNVFICFYDKNNNYLGYSYSINGAVNTTKSIPSNAKYLRFSLQSSYGTTYKNDICINVSNISLNGTYKPFIKNEYSLLIPVLRSAGSAQDDCNEVKVDNLDLSQQVWTLQSLENGIFTCDIPSNAKHEQLLMLCSKYAITNDSSWSKPDKSISYNALFTSIQLRDTSLNGDASLIVGTLNYAIATPTPQQAITLPEDMYIEQGGTIEVEYDEDYPTPGDFDFEVATQKVVEA